MVRTTGDARQSEWPATSLLCLRAHVLSPVRPGINSWRTELEADLSEHAAQLGCADRPSARWSTRLLSRRKGPNPQFFDSPQGNTFLDTSTGLAKSWERASAARC